MKPEVPSYALLRAVLLGGLFAGLMVAAFSITVSDRFVDEAVELEEQHAVASGEGEAHEDVFTRREQKAGLVVGDLFFGVMVASVFGGALALLYRELPGRTARAKALVLSAMAFVAAFVIPFAKYPSRPPAVGDPDTVYEREGLYLAVLALSVVAIILAARLWRAAGQRPLHRAGAAAAYMVMVAALLLFMPDNPDPIVDFPNDLLLKFRVGSVVGQAIFWMALGWAFGLLLERYARAEQGAAWGAAPD